MRWGNPMSEVIHACVLLIGCRGGDHPLIISSLTNGVQTRLIIEDVTKLSEGLERIAKGGVRAVIVDIEMPNARGVTAIETLLTTVPHIPLLVLSAVDGESVARQGTANHPGILTLSACQYSPGKIASESILSKSCPHQTEHSGWVLLSPHYRTRPKSMVYESVI